MDPDYVLLYECYDSEEALALRARLIKAGMSVQLQNDPVSRRFPKCATQIWAAREQAEEAGSILNSKHAATEDRESPRWRCPGCDEIISGKFLVCWNCSFER